MLTQPRLHGYTCCPLNHIIVGLCTMCQNVCKNHNQVLKDVWTSHGNEDNHANYLSMLSIENYSTKLCNMKNNNE